MLPLETDLNTLPMIPNIPEKVFPMDAKSTEGDLFLRLDHYSLIHKRNGRLLKSFYHRENIDNITSCRCK
jgi:hypothetical protein